MALVLPVEDIINKGPEPGARLADFPKNERQRKGVGVYTDSSRLSLWVFRRPLAEEPDMPASSHIDPPPPPASSGLVLIVEDNDTTRRRISTVLRRGGYDVIEATDGLDALKKVTAAPFDAIVLDLVLPHVDGWTFRATQLRHPELACIPTVIVTVQPMRAPERYALRAQDIIHKPFEDAELLNVVERVCLSGHALPRTVATDTTSGVGELFWSRRGEIACADHAPEASSGRWREERWAPVPAGAGNGRIVYRCEHCPGDGSPIDRSRRTSRQGLRLATRYDD